MTDTSLIAKLRQRIKDTRYARRAIGLSLDDTSATSAVAEITKGHLIVTVVGGTDASSFDFNLSDAKYNTVIKLKEQLDRLKGFSATLDEDAEVEHATLNLEPFGPTDIHRREIALKHHIFSDIELENVLSDAVVRHNPSFNINTLPASEHVFVLQLAHAQVCRVQSYDATKRKGLETEAKDLLRIAKDLESAYERDTKRLRRALVSPKEAPSNTMQQGDVVIGSQFKRNLRTGFIAPMSANIPPDAAKMKEPGYLDVEDDNIRFRWERNKDYDFYSYELWMDTRPEVVRQRNAEITFHSNPFAVRPTRPNGQTGDRSTTSKLIFRSFGANSNFDTVAFSTFVEEFGQLIQSYVHPDLEPETVYYARIYIVDLNYETVASPIMEYKTLPLRARFDQDNVVNVSTGPAGTTVRTEFRDDRGEFTNGHRLMLGGKDVAGINIIDPYTVEWDVPPFTSTSIEAKDLVVESPTKLIDKYERAFQVTS